MYKTVYRDRKFLNPVEGAAIINFSINHSGFDKKFNRVEIDTQISDCTKSIFLEFSFNPRDQKEYRKRIKKMDLLISSLQNLRTAIVKVNKEALKVIKKK